MDKIQILIIKWFFHLVFFMFLCTQEFNDLSQLKLLTMKAIYAPGVAVWSNILSHILITALCIIITWLYAKLLLTQGEGQFVSVAIIYVIISYEVITHVLQ